MSSAHPSQLRIADVSIRFGGITVLDSVSVDVMPNQVCGIIGPNGAGKTTLFNCVSRVYQPDRGRITLGEVDLLRLPAHRIAHAHIGRTFQNLGLFPSLTFLENTMVGEYSVERCGFVRSILRWGVRREERVARERAYELLAYLGLDHLAFNKAADQPFGTLKRLEIARALASNPALLLLDEPAGGLTNAEVKELSAVVRELPTRFDLSVLLVEHHMGFVMGLSDKVVAMALGRKIAEGTPAEIQQHPEVIAAYLGRAT